jgi:hypothetical protein
LPGKKTAFVVGACAGAAVTAGWQVQNWRPVVKQGVKTALTGTARVARAAEDLADIVHDVRAEVIRESEPERARAFAAGNGDARL